MAMGSSRSCLPVPRDSWVGGPVLGTLEEHVSRDPPSWGQEGPLFQHREVQGGANMTESSFLLNVLRQAMAVGHWGAPCSLHPNPLAWARYALKSHSKERRSCAPPAWPQRPRILEVTLRGWLSSQFRIKEFLALPLCYQSWVAFALLKLNCFMYEIVIKLTPTSSGFWRCSVESHVLLLPFPWRTPLPPSACFASNSQHLWLRRETRLWATGAPSPMHAEGHVSEDLLPVGGLWPMKDCGYECPARLSWSETSREVSPKLRGSPQDEAKTVPEITRPHCPCPPARPFPYWFVPEHFNKLRILRFYFWEPNLRYHFTGYHKE